MSALQSILSSPYSPFSRVEGIVGLRDEPATVTKIVSPRPLRNIFPTTRRAVFLRGAGTAFSEEDALLPATSEALERYCASTFSDDQAIWASADELGAQAVDLNAFPVCSPHELRDPHCPLQLPSKKDAIRWVKGLDLGTGAVVYLPLVAVYITHPTSKSERFLHPISTGCAAHTSYERALLGGLCEVVERDALSVAWLQRLPLPKIDSDEIFDALGDVGSACKFSSEHLQYHWFDATTDIGIPTIYGVRRSLLDKQVHTVVACSTSLDPIQACRKVFLELAASAAWLRRSGPHPGDVRNFDELHHGALYMAGVERSEAFRFLLDSTHKQTLRGMDRYGSLRTMNAEDALHALVAKLNALGYPVYAADQTTAEARALNMRCVRVVIPGLMPFSWVQRARFLGHPRLYEAPRWKDRTVEEPDINPWPQPFG